MTVSIIQLRKSSTPGSIPSSLNAGELAINLADKVLFSSNGTSVFQIAFAMGSVGGANTQVQFNDSSAANGSAGFVFNKTTNNVTVSNTLSVGTSSINSTVGMLGTIRIPVEAEAHLLFGGL